MTEKRSKLLNLVSYGPRTSLKESHPRLSTFLNAIGNIGLALVLCLGVLMAAFIGTVKYVQKVDSPIMVDMFEDYQSIGDADTPPKRRAAMANFSDSVVYGPYGDTMIGWTLLLAHTSVDHKGDIEKQESIFRMALHRLKGYDLKMFIGINDDRLNLLAPDDRPANAPPMLDLNHFETEAILACQKSLNKYQGHPFEGFIYVINTVHKRFLLPDCRLDQKIALRPNH